MDKKSFLLLFTITATFLLTQSWFDSRRDKQLTEWRKTHEQVETAAPEAVPPQKPVIEEKKPNYFILKNDYQELVFSESGASIVEINLPFKSSTYPKSIVLPVETDKKTLDRFPLVDAKDSQGNVVSPTQGGYYPLLRRAPLDSEKASLRSCALTSSYPEFASLPFSVTNFTPNSITFEARQAHRVIKKTFSFPKQSDDFPYCFNVDISIEGDRKGLMFTSGVPEIELMSGSSGAILKYRLEKGSKSVVEKLDLPKTVYTSTSIQPDWVCNSNGFFAIILDPLQGAGTGMTFSHIDGSVFRSRLSTNGEIAESECAGYDAQIPLNAKDPECKIRIFAGPLSEQVLSTIDENALKATNKPTNYLACQTFHGWFAFIAEPFAKFLFFLMKQFHSLFGSWALSIIFATIALRILLYPLNSWSLKSMKAIQEISPQVKAIQEKYKKEPAKAQMEIMALYREKKVNPFSGCLPLLIQMPFLLGMFDLLKSSFELRGACFIPGWIDNLAAPDTIYTWSFHIPLIGNQLHLLPFILGGTMWLQQYFTANLPKDSSSWTDQQRQQYAMGNIMTIVMTIMFYQFPAGLNIYWISSMVLGIIQQWWTTRKVQVK